MLRIFEHTPRCLCLLSLALSCAAHAGLGENIQASTADGQPLTAVTPSTNGILSQQVQSPQGTCITEYADAQGRVFALTWRGSASPDLRQLLGSARFAALQTASTQGGLHATMQSAQDVEVRILAVGRQFAGTAWAPSLLPTGFDLGTLTP